MTDTRKKQILMTIILIIFAGVFAFILYYLFTRTSITELISKKPVATTTIPGLPISGERPEIIPGEEIDLVTGLPTAGEITKPGPAYTRPEAVEQISTNRAFYTDIQSEGGLRYHNVADGKFYKIKSDGTEEKLSNKIFYNVDGVSWANEKDIAVIEYPDGNNTIYNFETRKQVSIPKHWREFSFSPKDNEIGAKSMGLSETNRWLISVKNDGTETKLKITVHSGDRLMETVKTSFMGPRK